MHLSPKELDKLVLHQAGFLAQKRYARGLKLNYIESVALLASQLLEFIREGDSVATLMDKGKNLLGLADVLPGVVELLHEVQVEGTFPDGSKLVTVHQPICQENGNAQLALYGSGLSPSSQKKEDTNTCNPSPGEFQLNDQDILLNEGRESFSLLVTNSGDRPVQVGSHYPFFETNPALRFDREKSYGYRLNIPAGTAVRFEPGEAKEVQLVELAGKKAIYGGNALISGETNQSNYKAAMRRVKEQGFAHEKTT